MLAVACVREQQVLVGLLGVGLLGDGPHQNPSVEHALGPVVQDAVEILVAGAVRLGVLDDHVVIGQLVAPGEVEPVEHAFQIPRPRGWRECRCGTAPRPGRSNAQRSCTPARGARAGSRNDSCEAVRPAVSSAPRPPLRPGSIRSPRSSRNGRRRHSRSSRPPSAGCCASATIRLRGSIVDPGSRAVPMKTRCTGAPACVPRGRWIQAPSWKKAVFSAANAFSAPWPYRVRCRSNNAAIRTATPHARLPTRTPAGRAGVRDSRPSNGRSRKTSRMVSNAREGQVHRQLRARPSRGSSTGRNGSFDHRRHVREPPVLVAPWSGYPSSANRASAAFRKGSNQAWLAARRPGSIERLERLQQRSVPAAVVSAVACTMSRSSGSSRLQFRPAHPLVTPRLEFRAPAPCRPNATMRPSDSTCTKSGTM